MLKSGSIFAASGTLLTMKRILLLIAFAVPLSGRAQSTTTFVPLQSVWKYLDNGSDQGTGWRAPAFADATWAQGPGELGYGDGGEATLVSYGPNAAAKYITTYFRKSFTVTGAAAYTTASLRVRRDDGVVIYLNGTEVYRTNLPAGTITYTTLAPAAIGGADESALLTAAVNAALLTEGTNVLAVEMHQNAGNSSDISFDMDFTGTIPGNVPTANAQSATLNEDTPKSITLTGSDPNGDPLTYTIVTLPAQGALSGTPPAVTYTPYANFSGTDSFTFKVSDGTNISAPATVSLTVTAVNDQPVANGQALTTPEDTALTLTVSGNDVESHYGTLTDYTQQLYNGSLTGIVDGLSGATWNENTGTLFFIRNVSAGAGHSYEYTSDGTLLRTITQSGFQDTEAIAWMYGDTYAIAEENDFQRITVCTISPGATTLDRTAAGNATWTTPVGSLLNLGIESLCYDAGRDLLYYTVEKPAAGAWKVYAMDPDTGVSQILCDVNASIALAGVATDLSDMAFDRATDTILFLSHESSKVIRINRAGAVLEQRGFTTAFTQAEALALTADRLRMFIGGEPKQFARYALPANTLTYAVVTPPAHGSLSGLPPLLTYMPVPNYFGPDNFAFRVHDGTVPSAAATVNLTVTPANDAPTGSGVSLSAEAAEPTFIVLPVSDPDGDFLTIQATAPAHGTVTLNGTTATYTGNAAYNGADGFTYTVSDGALTAGPFTVAINVLPVNAAPVARDQAATLNEDTPAPVVLTATDAENNPLIWTVQSAPAHGTLSGSAPNLTFTPAENYYGADSFSFRVSDGQESSNTATVSLAINPVNDAPAAQSLTVPTESNTPAPVTLTGTDSENSPLIFTIVTTPAHGTLTGTAPALTYTPAAGYTGGEGFTYKANDGQLDSAAAPVTITITAPVLDILVTAGSTWKYLDTGSNQGAAWRAASFDDTAWAQGPAQLGYGDGDEARVISYGPDSNNRYVTSYFRREFQLPNPNIITAALKLELLRDDGAVVYLNGTEILRSNMPTGTVAWNTLASSSISAPAESTFYTSALSTSLLLAGRNVLAVEVHQGALNSADVSFDLRLYESQPVITRGPYVQMTGTDRATVRWRTDVATNSKLDYGPGSAALTSSFSSAALRTEHEIALTGLTPDTRYFYAAGNSSGAIISGSTYYFTTHPPVGTVRPYRFWVLGDPGTGDANQTAVRNAFYAWNGAQQLAGVLVLGDTVYETGTDLEFQTKFFDMYPTMMRNTTTWPTFGNHDAGSASSATQSGPYYDSFTMPKFGEVGGVASGTEAYYSFNLGNVHFACLDSEGTSRLTTGNMAAWLEQDLSATTQEWIVAFWHHPPYSKGAHDSDIPSADGGRMKDMREVFVPILESHGVDLLLFGHEHSYQRSKFIDGHNGVSSTFDSATMLKQTGLGDPAGDGAYMKGAGPHQGAVFTVAGSSGKLNVYTLDHAAMAVNYVELGSVVLDVNGRDLTARFLNSAGVVRDTFSIVHNTAPLAAAGTLTGNEDAPLSVSISASDAENDALTYEIVTPPAVGTLTGTAPNLTFTPPANFNGTATFQFRVNDGRLNSATVTVTLNIAPVNDAPIASGQSVILAEDMLAVITLAGTDADGDALTFVVAMLPAHGTLTGVLPVLTYFPDADWRGVDSFSFVVSDGADTSPPAVVALTVRPVNDAPVAAAQSRNGDEDSPLPVILSATDADGDTLTFTVTAPPAHGSLTGTAPALLYTPNANWNGSDSFAFTVSDGTIVSVPAIVAVEVAAVNDAPLAGAQTLSADEDIAVAVTLTGSDTEGDALAFIITVPPAHGSLSGTAPNLNYAPDANWHGDDSVTIIVNDGTVDSAAAVIAINIMPVNDAPLTAAESLATDEDTALPVTLAGSDVDGDALAFTVTAQPVHGTLSGIAPDLTYTPEPDWNGVDVLSFAASDGAAVSLLAEVSITVTPVNDVPLAAAQSLSGTEDTAVTFTLMGSDADGDALTFAISALPVHGFLTGVLPALTYIPDAHWHGDDSFTFTVRDGASTSSPGIVPIIIMNDAPVTAAVVVSTEEDTAAAAVLTASDIDGDALTFSIATAPAHGTLSGSVPNLIYTPEADWNGEDNFTFIAGDGAVNSIPGIATITVTRVNDAPLAVAPSVFTAEDIALPVTLAGTDIDGDSLTFAVTVPPAHGTLSGIAPDLTYTPEANWSGPDSFRFTAVDGAATSAAVSVSITVTPVNDAPVTTAVNVTTEVGGPVAMTLTGSDREGDALTWNITALPAFGTLSGFGAARTYTPNPAWSGTDQFTFTVTDGMATSATTTATVTVASSGPWQLVARTGHTAPGAGGATFSIFAADFVSDATGHASFRGTAGTITAIWTEVAAGLEAVAAQTAAAPGVSGAAFDAVTTGPWAAGDGELLVFGKLLTGTGGVTSSNDFGYWHRRGGSTSLLTREDGAVPGMAAGAKFSVLSAVATLDAGGNYAYAATMKTNSSLGITSANDTGLWATFGMPARLLVRENNVAPGSSSGLFDTLTTASLVSNGAGQIGFASLLKVAGTITTANRYGLWMWDPAQFGLVARGGNAASGTPAGAVFAQPQQPSLGDGAMGFRSTLATGTGGVTTSNDTGLWILQSGVVSLLAREGLQAPGVAAGGLFNGFTEGASQNGGNELTFRTALRTGSGVTSANNAGMWVRSRFTANTLTLVARKGTAAPGAATATFASFDYPFIADAGGEVFTATLTTGTGGTTTANDRGLWSRNAAGSLALALREGTAFTLASGDVRTVSNITLPATLSSGRTPLSEEGRLLMLLTFTDASTALYHYTLP